LKKIIKKIINWTKCGTILVPLILLMGIGCSPVPNEKNPNQVMMAMDAYSMNSFIDVIANWESNIGLIDAEGWVSYNSLEEKIRLVKVEYDGETVTNTTQIATIGLDGFDRDYFIIWAPSFETSKLRVFVDGELQSTHNGSTLNMIHTSITEVTFNDVSMIISGNLEVSWEFGSETKKKSPFILIDHQSKIDAEDIRIALPHSYPDFYFNKVKIIYTETDEDGNKTEFPERKVEGWAHWDSWDMIFLENYFFEFN